MSCNEWGGFGNAVRIHFRFFPCNDKVAIDHPDQPILRLHSGRAHQSFNASLPFFSIALPVASPQQRPRQPMLTEGRKVSLTLQMLYLTTLYPGSVPCVIPTYPLRPSAIQRKAHPNKIRLQIVESRSDHQKHKASFLSYRDSQIPH